MSTHTCCDRCGHALSGKSYELFLMPHEVTREDYYRADLCEACYRQIAAATGLPPKPVTRWLDYFHPGMLSRPWKRFWKGQTP